MNGYYFRQSAKTRQWAEAEEVRVKLEEALIKGLPPFGTAVAAGSAPPIPTPADPPPPTSRTEVPEPRVPKPRPRVTVAQAVDAYLADAVSRSVESSTLKKLETIFRKQFLAWTRVEGIEYLDELDLDTLLNFRSTWEDGPLAKQKKQSRVIGFFWACVRRRYLTENPAIGLGKIKVVQIPTDYFPPDEFERIIAATYIRRGERGGGDVKANQTRLRTMTLLMRWSGLRIRDAVTLERHRLNGDSLLLYQAKTGTPVYVPLPPHVVEALENIPPGPKPNPRYFFWSGNGDPKERCCRLADGVIAVCSNWQISEQPTVREKRCHPHMFRDTFAVEMLLAGVPIDQVSLLARPRFGEDHGKELRSLREGTTGSAAGERTQCLERRHRERAAKYTADFCRFGEQACRMAVDSFGKESEGNGMRTTESTARNTAPYSFEHAHAPGPSVRRESGRRLPACDR